MKNILFLCTGNSARSVMAEAYVNHAAADRWRAFSAGSQPTGRVNPFALQTLRAHAIDPGAPHSKSWDEFAVPDAPQMDLVVTVCDNAAREPCPVWIGAPQTLHWGFPDPAAATGSDADQAAAFARVFADIRARIDAWLAEAEA